MSHSDFLLEMGSLMGLPDAQARALGEPAAFQAPGGLLCRLHLHDQAGATRVRPQVLLPVAAQELAGAEVRRLLSMQGAMLADLGWFLGLSVEGLLQLSTIAWIAEPREAVAALDVGNAIGLHALRALFDDDADTDAQRSLTH